MSLPVSIPVRAVALLLLLASYADANVQFVNATYYAEVTENQTDVQPVVVVTAIDPDDLDATINYILDPSTFSSNFDVNATTGVVLTSSSLRLDREANGVVNINVSAFSNNQTAGTATALIEVTLLDIDDNEPTFDVNNFTVEFPQNFQLGNTRQLPTATDADSPEYNKITYSTISLLNTFWDEYFEIDQDTAEMGARKACDGECKTKYNSRDLKFVFTLLANGEFDISVTVTAVLKYDDPNRYAPRFEKDTYALAVRNDTKAEGQVLLTVTAYDNDTGSDGRISYRIHPATPGRTQSIFSVQATSGNITFREVVDKGVGMYKFRVVATDDGKAPKSGTTEVMIFVRSAISISDLTTVIIVAACLSAVVLILVAVAIFLGKRYRTAKINVEQEKQDKAQMKRFFELQISQLQGTGNRRENPHRNRNSNTSEYSEIRDPEEDYDEPEPPMPGGSPPLPPWDPTGVSRSQNGRVPNNLQLPKGHEKHDSYVSPLSPPKNPDYLHPASPTSGKQFPFNVTSADYYGENSTRSSVVSEGDIQLHDYPYLHPASIQKQSVDA